MRRKKNLLNQRSRRRKFRSPSRSNNKTPSRFPSHSSYRNWNNNKKPIDFQIWFLGQRIHLPNHKNVVQHAWNWLKWILWRILTRTEQLRISPRWTWICPTSQAKSNQMLKTVRLRACHLRLKHLNKTLMSFSCKNLTQLRATCRHKFIMIQMMLRQFWHPIIILWALWTLNTTTLYPRLHHHLHIPHQITSKIHNLRYHPRLINHSKIIQVQMQAWNLLTRFRSITNAPQLSR